MPYLLAIDVGNTNITVGAFDGERLLKLWRLGTDPNKTADEYGSALKAIVSNDAGGPDPRRRGPAEVEAVVYGSVVPALNPAIEGAARRYFGVEAVAVDASSPVGLRFKVEQPAEVGADRVLNALAAVRLVGKPCVVIDFGTATTFDCVSAKSEYLGGAILIGPKVAAAALARYTAKLPEVEVAKPLRVIGDSTVSCIQRPGRDAGRTPPGEGPGKGACHRHRRPCPVVPEGPEGSRSPYARPHASGAQAGLWADETKSK